MCPLRRPARPGHRLVLAIVFCMVLLRTAAADEGEKQPFELPTLSGQSGDFHLPDKPAAIGPLPDARELFDIALSCWPAPSYFRGELNLEGRLRTDRSTSISNEGALSAGSRASVALVARIPLYSASELDRDRQREYDRRTRAAEAVGALVWALTDRVRAERELELVQALERRSQQRVKVGVADTTEQVAYLEKVSALQGTVFKQSGEIQKSRLALLAICSADTADQVDQYIGRYVKRGPHP
ncbi:hypothetical protein GT347_27185 (plasmid) [Xylophilus rhododendri]|uniref:Outer membrane efflux protein n=1 Tax=Xylophilus rhododendri TaxID=2697032 RepID=A0A857JEW2_9BURK|nr:hypothetical protein [Xylophilus rhododendri]QHJ01744.1 hypothetical protein GT347_27185 [Xylophilus rhododendri]